MKLISYLLRVEYNNNKVNLYNAISWPNGQAYDGLQKKKKVKKRDRNKFSIVAYHEICFL